MAKFGEVFSTTWKVLLALFVISLGIGLISLVIGVLGRAGGGSSSSDEWTRTYHVQNADEAYTKMPKSQWDAEIKRCIKEHTVIEGLTKDQVKQAVGGAEPWSYSIITLKGSDQKCIRYSGEQCVEYPPDEVKTFNLHFTPKGNLIWDDDSIGLSVYDKIKPQEALDSANLKDQMGTAQTSALDACIEKNRVGVNPGTHGWSVIVESCHEQTDPNYRGYSGLEAADACPRGGKAYTCDTDPASCQTVVMSGRKWLCPPSGDDTVATCPLLGPCYAILRNGYSIRHEHRMVIGTTTRLYLAADDSTFTDVPTEEIIGYKPEKHP